MQASLFQRLNQLVLLNPSQQRALSNILETVEMPKDSLLLEAGQISSHLYFVVEGILRSSYTFEDKEVTRWFCFAEHFATSYFSFVYRQPSEDTIMLLTDAKLLAISHTNLQYLSQQDSVWIDLNRHLLEHYYTNSLERIASFQTQSTLERYEHLLQQHPTIEDDVPLGYLASYLGMTQETLSRIRRKKKRT
ncbi:MAG: Crp/Fnr family transcriptional regulator [Leptolyngbyaceae cyanobacterium]